MTISQWVRALGASLAQVVQRLGERLPDLLGATVLIVIGWLLARVLRTWSVRVMTAAVERASRRIPALQATLRQSDTLQLASAITGGLVFWAVFLIFLAAAVEILGLPVITGLLGRLAAYLPNLLGATLIVALGVLIGSLARGALASAARSAGLSYGDLLGRSVQVTVVLVAFVIGAGQIGLDSSVLVVTLAVITGTAFGGAALAFGLGAGTTVNNLIASHYVLQTYQVGQTVRIAGVEGRIAQITGTAVVLDSRDGRVIVPARKFSEETTVVLVRET